MKKFFNSETNAGRANVAKATYASIAVMYLFYRLRKSSKKKVDMSVETTQAAVETVPPNCVNMSQKMHQNSKEISMADQNVGKPAKTCPRLDGAGRDGSANKVQSESSDSSKSSEIVDLPPVKAEKTCKAKQAVAAGEQKSSPPKTETDQFTSKNETDQLASKIDASLKEEPQISEPPKKAKKCGKDIILLMPPPDETKEPEVAPNDKQNTNTLPDNTKINEGNANEDIAKTIRQSYCARKRLRDLELAEKEPQPLAFFEENNKNKAIPTETEAVILATETSPNPLQTDFEKAKENALPIIEKKKSIRERYLSRKSQNLPQKESTLNFFQETASKVVTDACVIC